MSETMQELMDSEREQALAMLKEANDLLMKLFNVSEE